MTIGIIIHNAVTKPPIFKSSLARSLSLFKIPKYAMIPPINPNKTGKSIHNPLGLMFSYCCTKS